MSVSLTGPGGTLDKNAFLQLMVTQMQYQDPLQPQDSSQFLSQLAQFTALEQMTNVATTESQVLYVNQLATSQRLIGQTVTVQDANHAAQSGVVTGVKVVNGEPQLVIGGQTYSLTDIVEIGGEGA